MDPWASFHLGPWSGLRRERLKDERFFLERHFPSEDRDLLFLGATELLSIEEDGTSPFEVWRGFLGDVAGWSYGILAFDLKNGLNNVSSRHSAPEGVPGLFWAVPRLVLERKGQDAFVHLPDGGPAALLEEARSLLGETSPPGRQSSLEWTLCTSREAYLARARDLLAHIQRGDIYEVNYCVERRAKAIGWDPFLGWERLRSLAQAPHGAFLRIADHFVLCASPESFLRFDGDQVSAEPMKGTRPRHQEHELDARLAYELRTDEKERSENVMTVDVMRNDLSRVARPGSVRVDELFAVRTHPGVHQLVSKVSATMGAGFGPVDVIQATWPMASMTGAPKLRAMQLIDKAEDGRRGLFSGSIGWFAPDGTGDLNVVIRTLLHDAVTGTCSLSTGSALTALCDPEKEWEECQLKARSVIDALEA